MNCDGEFWSGVFVGFPIGMFALGFFVVGLAALKAWRAEKQDRSRLIEVNKFLATRRQ